MFYISKNTKLEYMEMNTERVNYHKNFLSGIGYINDEV